MKALFGILGLLSAAAIIHVLYTSQVRRAAGDGPPRQQIELVRVRTDLLALAQAERLYMASNGRFATLEELRTSGGMDLAAAGRRGYVYDVQIENGLHFRIIARPSDASNPQWPTLSIDENMRISLEVTQH
jgi:hypothetical protein